MADFSRDQFDFSNDVWQKMQKKEIDPNVYGVPGRYTGLITMTMIVCGDLASILGTEYATYQFPSILSEAMQNDNQLSSESIEILNRISEGMKSLDADNVPKLQEIYNNTPQIHFTGTFNQAEKGGK